MGNMSQLHGDVEFVVGYWSLESRSCLGCTLKFGNTSIYMTLKALTLDDITDLIQKEREFETIHGAYKEDNGPEMRLEGGTPKVGGKPKG